MKYKLIVSDFDGTLGNKNDISSENISAIQKFVKLGGKFAICTGRPYTSIKDICEAYNLDVLTASYQGASIKEARSGKTLLTGGLELESALLVIDAVLKAGESPAVFIDDVLYYQGYCSYAELYKNEDAVLKLEKKDLLSFVKENNQKVLKIVFHTDHQKVKGYRETFGKVFPYLSVNSGGEGLVEFINPKYNKGSSVRFLANYYNVPIDEVIAVGDFNNDFELVSGPWHGVAVGDGSPELKKVAKEVTVPFKEHPIKYLIEKYCL